MASSVTYRPMARCMACRRWWSVTEAESLLIQAGSRADHPPTCPCGSYLELVDMAKHMATVPQANPEKP